MAASKHSIEDLIKNTLQVNNTLIISLMAHSYASYLKILAITKEIGINLKTITKHPIIQYRIINQNDNKLVITDEGHDIEGTNILVSDKSTISWIFGIRKKKMAKDKVAIANALAFIPDTGKPIVFSDIPVEKNEKFDFCSLLDFTKIISQQNIKSPIKINYFQTPAYFVIELLNKNISIVNDLQTYMQYTKNKTEAENMKEGAFETSVSLIRFLAHLEYNVQNNKKISEKEAVAMLQNPRAIDFSFKPICATGTNTAYVHYDGYRETNCLIENESLFLIDIGFHFKNSTTDMTRTLYIGNNCPAEFIKVYTIVLKSLIFYTMSKFPENFLSSSLDAICRYHMRQYHLDYNFSTGHGVGNYRLVHESPTIGQYSSELIQKDMVTTVEPGYYTKDFGIRVENMLLSAQDQNSNFLHFETLTLIPFCNKLINRDLLSTEEINWLKNYNTQIWQRMRPIFLEDEITINWLKTNVS
jgi:Xaa-Pro aminopeptidase